MDADLWSRLLSEIGERVLSYLSAPVLCRFRTVCKGWNSLICSPRFGALCIQNATQDAASFVALSYIDKGNFDQSGPAGKDQHFRRQSRGWVLLDVKAKRWYIIKAKRTDQELFDRFDSTKYCGRCLAMDGGLVCQVLSSHKNASLLVCNPISQTESRMLPTPKQDINLARSVVDMVVDVSTGCYTIFVLPSRRKPTSEENPFMVIYESRTDAWRSSSLPVITRELCVGVESSSVCFNGLLYVLAWADSEDPRLGRGHNPLWSYNHIEDNWKDTGVVINSSPLYNLTFLVSDNRLFLAAWVPERKDWMYQVSEIDLQERTIRTVLRVTEAAMMELFEVLMDVMRHPPVDMRLQAFGLGKVIVLLSRTTGITRVYDLRTCTWDAPGENPLAPTMMLNFKYQIYYGKRMNLVMPSVSESWKKDVTEVDSLANV